jgi:hypothetical protein
MLERVVEPMLRAREALQREFHTLHRALLAIVRHDGVCRRPMAVPGVGALVAITFTSAIDDPARFRRSRAVGAHFGLTPKKHQSGETDVTGGISRVGDAMVRTALDQAARIMLTRAVRFSGLKRWALEVARRRGMKRAKVALARKLAAVLLRLWTDGSAFRCGKEAASHLMVWRGQQGGLLGLAGTRRPRRGPVAGTRDRRGRKQCRDRSCSETPVLDWSAGSLLMA